MSESDWVWLALIAAGAAYEGYALRDSKEGNTLSEATRSLFRVKTSRAGRWVFGVSWTALSAWFAGHVLHGWPFPGF